MSNLGCYDGQAGMDDQANYAFCSLARNCCAAQQIHKAKNVVTVFLWNGGSVGRLSETLNQNWRIWLLEQGGSYALQI